MKTFIRRFISIEALIILLFSLTPLLWLSGSEIVVGHDSGFRLNPQAHMQKLTYSWDETYGLGVDWSLFKGFLVTQAPEAIFAYLTQSVQTGQTLTFIFWFLAMGLSMYIFTRSFFPGANYRLLRIVASTAYMYNFFLLQAWFIVERAKFSVYAFFPLGLMVIIKTLDSSWSIMSGFIVFSLTSFFLNGGGNPTLFGFVLIGYGATFIVYLVRALKRKDRRALIRWVSTAVLFSLGFVLINAYWILPQVDLALNSYTSTLEGTGGIDSVIGWEHMINAHASILNIFRFQGMPDWYDNPSHLYANAYLQNPLLVIFSFIPLAIIIAGQIVRPISSLPKNTRLLISTLFVLWFIGIIFTSGSHPPFGVFYVALIRYVPGFAIFRSAFYKFGSLYWFTAIFLAAFYLHVLYEKYADNIALQGKKKAVAALFFVVLILLYHSPFFSGDFFVWNKPFSTKLEIPAYAREMSEYINSLSLMPRILLFPPLDRRVHADSYEWGFFSLDTFLRLSSNASVVTNYSNSGSAVQNLYELISKGEIEAFMKLANELGITHILWRGDVLFIDKVSTSSMFDAHMKLIEERAAMDVAYENGPWKLFALRDASAAPFSIRPYATAMGGNNYFSILSQINQLPQTALYHSLNSENTYKMKKVPQIQQIEKGFCLICETDIPSTQALPHVLLLPDSQFYQIVIKREHSLESQVSDPYMAALNYRKLLNTRITEISRLIDRESEKTSDSAIGYSIARYKEHIQRTQENIDALSGERKLSALSKVRASIAMNKNFMDAKQNPQRVALTQLYDFRIYLSDTIGQIEKQMAWSVQNPLVVRYVFDMQRSDEYTVLMTPESEPVDRFQIDGKDAERSTLVPLAQGMHTIDIDFSDRPSVIDLHYGGELAKITVPPRQDLEFEIPQSMYTTEYVLTFDYRVTAGKPVVTFAPREDTRIEMTINFDLTQDGSWQQLHEKVGIAHMGNSVLMKFRQTESDESAVVEIRNFKLIPLIVPDVYLAGAEKQVNHHMPELTYKKLNPSSYTVSIENAQQPFVLSLNQSYHDGWQAHYESGELVSGHLEINNFANGWVIDRPGKTTISIRYAPQKMFTYGSRITIIMLILLPIIGTAQRMHYKYGTKNRKKGRL